MSSSSAAPRTCSRSGPAAPWSPCCAPPVVVVRRVVASCRPPAGSGAWPCRPHSLSSGRTGYAVCAWEQDSDRGYRRVVVPGYPYQRRRYWVDRANVPTPAATPSPGVVPVALANVAVAAATAAAVDRPAVAARPHAMDPFDHGRGTFADDCP